MGLNLTKSQGINLTKTNDSGLSEIIMALGWDEGKKGGMLSSMFGSNIDCDASVFLTVNGKIVSKNDIICYNNRRHSSGAVRHQGDNLTGKGDGDDERINIDLKRIPEKYDGIKIVVNIYSAKQRKQHFGMIQNAFARVVDARNNNEICRYNLSGNYDGKTAMIFGELTRNAQNEWTFTAIGEGNTANSIEELAREYS